MGWSEDGVLAAVEELGHLRLIRSLRLDWMSGSGRCKKEVSRWCRSWSVYLAA